MSKRQRLQRLRPGNPTDSAAMHYIHRIYNKAVHRAVAKELHKPENKDFTTRKAKKELKRDLMRITHKGITG